MSQSSERLARSRLAILEHIQCKQQSPGAIRSALNKVARAAGLTLPAGGPAEQAEPGGGEPDAATRPARQARRAYRFFGGRFAGLGDAGRAYWRNHPVHLVAELATPALSSYARRRPMAYLAIAAGAGALLYLARPWRLISISGLAIAALRSPQLSSALVNAIYGKGSQDLPPPPP